MHLEKSHRDFVLLSVAFSVRYLKHALHHSNVTKCFGEVSLGRAADERGHQGVAEDWRAGRRKFSLTFHTVQRHVTGALKTVLKDLLISYIKAIL